MEFIEFGFFLVLCLDRKVWKYESVKIQNYEHTNLLNTKKIVTRQKEEKKKCQKKMNEWIEDKLHKTIYNIYIKYILYKIHKIWNT